MRNYTRKIRHINVEQRSARLEADNVGYVQKYEKTSPKIANPPPLLEVSDRHPEMDS